MKDRQLIPKRKVKTPKLKLEQMFKQQRKFQKRFYDFKKMKDSELTDYIRLMLTCINVEAVEALNWRDDWKPWKKQVGIFNRYEYLNELVDIQHFLVNAALAVECTADEFSSLFVNKGKENINRQKRGY